MRLDLHYRRLASYLYIQDLIGGAVLELGPRDARSAEVLVEHGAERVLVVGPEAQATRTGAIEVRAGSAQATGAGAGEFDLVCALPVAEDELAQVIAEARRVLKPGGALVVGCESRDRPGARVGVSYYDLVDRLAEKFAAVTMIGQAPFAGATLVEYGVKDPEPLLDGTLVDKGERVDFYIAVAAATRRGAAGYAVVQVPVAEVAEVAAVQVAQNAPAAAVAQNAPAQNPAPGAATQRSPAQQKSAPPKSDAELANLVEVRGRALDEAREAARLHSRELDSARAQLAERDAYIGELERGARELEKWRASARQSETRASAAESAERRARLELSQAQGRLLRDPNAPQISDPVAAAPAPVAVAASPDDLNARVAELEKENAKLREREEDARADSWKHLRARSDAEAQAADVREDTVRKLKDARKLASVELTRAMEEATRKAIGLKDELNRTERERKELINELKAAREELETLRQTASVVDARQVALAREEGAAQMLAMRAAAERSVHDEESARAAAEHAERAAEERLDTLRGRVVALERELSETRLQLESERERATQLSEVARRLESESAEIAQKIAAGAAAGAALDQARADHEHLGKLLEGVEREANRRAGEALRIRQSLKDREREVEALRHEIAQRDARLIALEQQHPPHAEVERIEAEVAQARVRVQELQLELTRKEAAVERAAQAASHERARAERLVAEERRALHDRNEARARGAEAEARAAALQLENERLLLSREAETERAHKAEGEVRERKERVKQLKRELEESERRAQVEGARAASVDAVRERLTQMETALRGEEQRMAMMEEALRRAAAQAAAPE